MMKKETLKTFAICFAMDYVLVAGLCILNKQPLIFVRDYSLGQFIALFFLLGFLSFALVFLMESLERLLKKSLATFFTSSYSIYAYFILVSALALFAFTMFSGFVESGILFYYYGCVTNSCTYLFSGYTVTFVMAVYFAYRFVKTLSAKKGS